ARRLHRRPGRLGGGVAGRRLPQALAQGTVQLLAPDHHLALPAGGAVRQARPVKLLVVVALLVLLALPAVLSSYALTIFILILFYAFLGQAWNIVGGYTGQLSAGPAAFVGVGAYTAALLSSEYGLTPWLGMFVGAALATGLGA